MATFLQLTDATVYVPGALNEMSFAHKFGSSVMNWQENWIRLETSLPNGEKLEAVFTIEHMELVMRDDKEEPIETAPADIALGRIKVSHTKYAQLAVACVYVQRQGTAPLYMLSNMANFDGVQVTKTQVKWSPFRATKPPFDLGLALTHA